MNRSIRSVEAHQRERAVFRREQLDRGLAGTFIRIGTPRTLADETPARGATRFLKGDAEGLQFAKSSKLADRALETHPRFFSSDAANYARRFLGIRCKDLLDTMEATIAKELHDNRRSTSVSKPKSAVPNALLYRILNARAKKTLAGLGQKRSFVPTESMRDVDRV